MTNNWREDPSLHKLVEYVRKFAFLPVKCNDHKVWLTTYYIKYEHWFCGDVTDNEYVHTDRIENITEDEYIVRRLRDGI
jgi:hypothetical protein